MSITSANPEYSIHEILKMSRSSDNESDLIWTVVLKSKTRYQNMILKLDYYFPFIVFFCGLVILFVLETPHLIAIAKKEMPKQLVEFEKHRKIAFLSVVVGGFWSLQNLWF